jgi:hypothetical protein
MTGLRIPTQHIGKVWAEWLERGEPMPFALVQGPAPAISCVPGIPLPDGVNEADYVGALLGEPVELVKAVTVDLEVPATAEIVIEGQVSLTRDSIEGSFGEYLGCWKPNPVGSRPITWRRSRAVSVRRLRQQVIERWQNWTTERQRYLSQCRGVRSRPRCTRTKAGIISLNQYLERNFNAHLHRRHIHEHSV